MKKNILLIVSLLLIGGQMLNAGSYNLNERETVDLSGIDEILFDLRGPKCALCVNSLDIFSSLLGEGSGNDLVLSLEGDITSNRRKAVPDLIIDKTGRTLVIRIFTDERTFFGLSQRGKARFEGLIPSSFTGDIKAQVSSGEISVQSIQVNNLVVESSSGDMSVEDTVCDRISLELSSGDLEADQLITREALLIKSSSGELNLGTLNGETIDIKASSGDINIGTLMASESTEVNSSSGEISADQITSSQTLVKTSSGTIGINLLETLDGALYATSGDIILGSAEAVKLDIELSSGDLKIAELIGDRTFVKTTGKGEIENARGALKYRGSSGDVFLGVTDLNASIDIDLSSGDINLIAPGNSSFDIYMDTSSGDKRSDFDILGKINNGDDEIEGTVNGGGISVVLKTSSGDIKLLKD